MGLLTIIKKQKLKDKEIRCLILGLDNSGKSTIVNKLLPENEKDDEISPTVGFQIHTLEYNTDSQRYQIALWDVGGQTTLRPFWDNYFDRTDVLIWCIDASLPLRFSESFKELKCFLLRDEGRIGYDCQVIIAMNKMDLLQDARALDEIKTTITKQLGSMIPIVFVGCSGLTGEGLSELLSTIVSKREHMYMM
ncbi:hypothetical protein HG535_0D00920 [Zygotorulaspora mrakii]|uniref:GTP-binding protein n=1 Tax=Zygotorulaspora mrakii TaxID=42260 RepID=A0A7H9B1X8_ZYGMR|nr:uncharacterized protein HG535_0D00920 [Zygotorulaspora mrakii]QLG72384.1 hypothetical protein HG535_0D00920 [Zygotorulaspora mrakii]